MQRGHQERDIARVHFSSRTTREMFDYVHEAAIGVVSTCTITTLSFTPVLDFCQERGSDID